MTKIHSRVFASARPGRIEAPVRKDVSAFTRPEVFERWDAGVRAVSVGDNVITMFDVIGEDFWTGGGVTAKKVAAQLRAIGDRPVEVQVNSPGGDFFEGIAIYNLLREHPQPITVKVMGIAASAASVIAMAGDTVEIGEAGFFMIHNASVLAYGNRHDMREMADFLEPFDAAMADVYVARTGQDKGEVAAWLDAETWMNGTQAIERGFADALLSADQVTQDEAAGMTARLTNDVRAMELQLIAGGATRAEARARIKRIKGTPGAALNDGTPGAADTDELGAVAELLAALTK